MSETTKEEPGFFKRMEQEATAVSAPAPKVFVYETPIRLWHWINALCIVVLCVTGYLIGEPPPSVPGEASDSFLLGNIRMVHFAAGQILALAFLGRIYWAIVGNDHARQVFILPIWSRKWWGELFHEIRWYGFLARRPKKYIGHNPLATFAMFFMLILPLAFQILSGMALYAEGQGIDSWWYAAFGWMFYGLGIDSFTMHTYHHIGMWIIVLFAMVHIYAAIREDFMSDQSLLSTMLSGWRTFKDDKE